MAVYALAFAFNFANCIFHDRGGDRQIASFLTKAQTAGRPFLAQKFGLV
jgi:hypothetical protein